MRNGTAIRTASLAGLLWLSAPAVYAQTPASPYGGNPEPFADSIVYRLTSSSLLQVKTGKAGVFGFAGHNHLIESHAVQGEVVYYPRAPERSHLEITVYADSLQVLTPPDTEETRKVGETMRTEVLRTADYPVIRLVSREVQPKAGGYHLVGDMTLVGQTRSIPLDVVTRIQGDTLEATSSFAIKQTDFGITPFKGGPGGAVKVADQVQINFKAVGLRDGSFTSAGSTTPTKEAAVTPRRGPNHEAAYW